MLVPYALFSMAGLYLLFADLFKNTKALEYILFGTALVFCGVGIFIYLPYINSSIYTYFNHKLFVSDPLGNFMILTIIFVLALVIIISKDFLKKYNYRHGEYYSLLFFSALGMMLLISANSLLIAFLGLEIMSIPLYILSGFLKTDSKSKESAMKYFILGAFSTGLFAMGIAFVYGATGSFDLYEIANSGIIENKTLMITGLGLILIGLGFKIALVPFHMWVPDVYEGAPTPVVAFMSVTVKVATFVALARIFVLTIDTYSQGLIVILEGLAIVTMTLGNLAAIYQKNIKRMLAYSSIAHAGYMLIALIAAKSGSYQGIGSLVFYLFAYCIMTFGSFAIVSYYEDKEGQKAEIEDYSGLAYKRPFIALCLSVFLLSLAGIPLTAGFMGKLYIFGSAIDAGFLSLAIIGVINSLISVYYYLRVIVCMYMKKSELEYSPKIGFATKLAVFICTLLIMVLGIYPSLLLKFTDFISYISS